MKEKPHLLLVDDDFAAMRHYVLALERAGYSVTQKRSVAEAIEFLNIYSSTLDGVILDVMLPPGDKNHDVTSEFGQAGGLIVFKYMEAAHPGIPILVLSTTAYHQILGEFKANDSVLVRSKLGLLPSAIAEVMHGLVGFRPQAGGEQSL